MLLGDQNFTLADMVGCADKARIFHLLDKACGFVIADRQFALDI